MAVIDERMRFETFNDFYLRRRIIRDLFCKCNDDSKEIYRYYLYANSLLSTMKKDCIWEYLVEPRDFYTRVDCDLRRYYNKGGDTIEYAGGDTEENW